MRAHKYIVKTSSEFMNNFTMSVDSVCSHVGVIFEEVFFEDVAV